jgi:hypothetical protein
VVVIVKAAVDNWYPGQDRVVSGPRSIYKQRLVLAAAEIAPFSFLETNG